MKLSLNHYSYIFIFGLIALIPLLLLFNSIRQFAVNVPDGDEWSHVTLIAKMRAGQLTWNDLWEQHNEHRIFFPRLLMLGLARLHGWDTTLETYASFSLAVLTWLLLQRLLVSTLPTARLLLFPPLMAAMSLLIFSLQQGRSLLWGFQVVWFVNNFFVILAISALTFWRGQWRGIILAALAAVVATYSLAAGQLVWGAVLIGLLLDRKTWRPSLIIFWFVVMLLAIGAYFYNYQSHSNQAKALLVIQQQPFTLIQFILAYLGSPLGTWGNPAIPVAYGLAGLVGLMLATVWLWRRQPQARTAILPWLQLTLFAGASALITALGRLGLGVNYAVVSKYVVISILFWIGLAVILTMAGREFFLRQPRWRWSSSVLAGIAIGLVLTGYLHSAIRGAIEIEAVGVQMKTGLAAFYHYPTAPDNSLSLLRRPASLIRPLAKVLEDLHEGPFSSQSKTENDLRLQDDGWGQLLNSDHYGYSAYPTDLIEIAHGNSVTLTRTDNTLAFSNSDPLGSSFYIDLAKAQQSWPLLAYPFLQPPVLEVQSKNALYLHIFWYTSHGLGISEESTVYGLELSDGWKHFRHSIWPGAQAFRIDLQYFAPEPVSDNVKIGLYQSR